MSALFRSLSKPPRSRPPSFNLHKKEAIDYLFRQCTPTPISFADLGGVWAVDGAYTFYTLQTYAIRHAFLVDAVLTAATLGQAQNAPRLTLMEENFGKESVAEKIGNVDAVFLFDVLLHQVAPDWNEILERYSKLTTYLVVYNPQWTGSSSSVRLLDLGKKEYFRNIPHGDENPIYNGLFNRLAEIHPHENRTWRDIHPVWQWGITNRDLLRTMEELNFTLRWHRNNGPFRSLPNFENHAFVFQKT